jgi:hypothetical protein
VQNYIGGGFNGVFGAWRIIRIRVDVNFAHYFEWFCGGGAVRWLLLAREERRQGLIFLGGLYSRSDTDGLF